MKRIMLLCAICTGFTTMASAQDALRGYITPTLTASIDAVAKLSPEQRTDARITDLLPVTRPIQFVEMIRARQAPTARAFQDILGQVDALRLNKTLAGGPGVGGTGLVSRVVAPAVLGAAVEYGGILQEASGTVTTLRGNVLGVARLLFGVQQFPDCPLLSEATCPRGTRHLRAISGSVSFENTRTDQATTAATAAGTASLLSEDYRVPLWGVRLDLTPSNNLDDPKYLSAWNAAIDALANDPSAAEVSLTVVELLSDAIAADDGVYIVWQPKTIELLRAAPADQFRNVLAERLVLLVGLMEAADPAFAERVNALARAYANYEFARGRLLTAAQVHKLSLEYTNRRPGDQPFLSNVRLIYSHQPTAAPVIMTLNAAASWYHQLPTGANDRLRDVQVAGQVDRPLGDVASLGQAVLSLAGYYQWMKNDALLLIPAGTTAPGSGIELPREASTLLGTKGHIGILQAKLSLTLTEAVKVPFSMTWATRKELIKDKDVRGQIGLTLDIDQLLH